MRRRLTLYTRMWRAGTGLYAQGVVEGLVAAGHRVTFIAPDGAPDDPAASLAAVRRIRPPREIVGAASKPKRAAASLARIASGLMALLAARFTSSRFIVTIPDPFVFSLWPMMLLRATGARLAIVCHDPKPHAWTLPPALRWLDRAGYHMLYWTASDVVVLSERGGKALNAEFGVPLKKISVIPHGLFHQDFAGPVPGSRELLLFGTIRRNKQVHLAIRAIAEARRAGLPVSLIVAGEADANDRAYIDQCRAEAESAGDAVKLEFGFVETPRLAELLARCDALLLPYTDFDSQSGVAVLAGAAGRPVIAAPAGGIRDLIAQGLATTEIAEPCGAAEIAVAIRAFYSEPAEVWSERARRARERLDEALGWPRIGALFAQLFEPRVSGTSARAAETA